MVTKTQLEGSQRYLIQHPDTEMTDEQRAWEMWAVHPLDLDGFGMSRQEFFLAHIRAAKGTK